MAPESNPARVTVEVEGLGEVDVVGVRGEEGLSELFTYEAQFRVEDQPIAADLVGLKVSFVISDRFEGERRVTGVIAEASVSPQDIGDFIVDVVVRPAAYPLTLGRDCRAFHDLDVVGIVQAVCQTAGVKLQVQTSASYHVRTYTVQYRESDWAFVCRLMEEEGIFYWFDHASDSVLCIADTSPTAPDLEGGAELVYRAESGMEASNASVSELGPVRALRTQKFSLRSFDFTKPSFKVEASSGEGDFEEYDAPGGNASDPAVLQAWTKVRQERAAIEANLWLGRSGVCRLAPGRCFQLFEHSYARYDGSYLVTGVEFAFSGLGNARGGAKQLEVRFRAVPKALPYRPKRVTPWPVHPGLQGGQVVGASGEEVFPDDKGRVRVQQHWDRLGSKDDKGGYWFRVSQRGTAGSQLLPRVGWNVLSVGEEGCVDMPIVVARTFDAEHPPPYPLPENKTRVVYKTATVPADGTANELRYEDKEGSEEIFVNATKDMQVLVQDHKTDIIYGYHKREVGVDHSLDVGKTYDSHIKGDQVIKIGSNQTETVATDRAKTVEGNETITIGAARKEKSGANLGLAADTRTLSVGAAQIDVTIGAIETQSKVVNTLVGGAVVKATPRTMEETVGSTVGVSTAIGVLPASAGEVAALPGVSGALSTLPTKGVGASFQTIGLVKVEDCINRGIEVGKTYAEKVVGMMELITKSFTDQTVGPLTLKALAWNADAESIQIHSPEKVELQCGGTTLTVSKDEIKLSAPKIDLSGATMVAAKGGKIHHNQ